MYLLLLLLSGVAQSSGRAINFLATEANAFSSSINVFASRFQADAAFDPDEPIMMLPCGVLISKGGIDALTPREPRSAPADATFKCINCSRVTEANECKRVFF